MADATKANTQIDDWTLLNFGNLVKGSEADVSTQLNMELAVTVVHADADPNALGVLVIVQWKMGPNNEDWRDLYRFRMGAGTADTTTLDAEATSPTSDVPLTATSDFQVLGSKAFILAAPLVDSEVITIADWGAGVSVTAVDILTNTQDNGSSVFNGVAEKPFPIPDSASAVRVLLVNDDDNADMAYRVDLAEITSIG